MSGVIEPLRRLRGAWAAASEGTFGPAVARDVQRHVVAGARSQRLDGRTQLE